MIELLGIADSKHRDLQMGRILAGGGNDEFPACDGGFSPWGSALELLN
jgi:hypothetical protein